MAARQRRAQERGVDPASVEPPRWRPFQLAFLLMNLQAFVTPTHTDRELVDLLFFPTGGGKTEAYFGLSAFAILLRRLRDPSLTSAGWNPANYGGIYHGTTTVRLALAHSLNAATLNLMEKLGTGPVIEFARR